MTRLRTVFFTLFILFAAMFTGCSSAPYMPLSNDKDVVDSGKPLYLMSVSIKNEYKQRWQPRVLSVFIAENNGAEKRKAFAYRMDDNGEIESSDDNGVSTFLVRFTTDSEAYLVDGFVTHARAFPVNAFYALNLQLPIPQKANGVHYLGAVKATIRERKDNEFRAGPVIPLIDQAVAGASTGTFDVVVSDAFERDTDLFKKTYPALKNVNIQKALLPAWDRAKIQALWEKN